MVQEAIKLGQRGTLTIPQRMRAELGLEEGALLLVELREGMIVLRPAIAVPIEPETYTARRKAEFLLNNALDAAEYAEARRQVAALGVDPDSVPDDRRGAP